MEAGDGAKRCRPHQAALPSALEHRMVFGGPRPSGEQTPLAATRGCSREDLHDPG